MNTILQVPIQAFICPQLLRGYHNKRMCKYWTWMGSMQTNDIANKGKQASITILIVC